MHELPFTISMLDIVLEHAGTAHAGKVTRIDLVVGKLTGLVPECIQFQFDVIKKGTIAEEAVLSFNHPETQLRCRNCGIIFIPEHQRMRCPECGKRSVDVVAGKEYYVESIEVE
ncbi:MAG: hydrogenase maturation nickel metallochaperone HypA [Desulfobacterales bacterium]